MRNMSHKIENINEESKSIKRIKRTFISKELHPPTPGNILLFKISDISFHCFTGTGGKNIFSDFTVRSVRVSEENIFKNIYCIFRVIHSA